MPQLAAAVPPCPADGSALDARLVAGRPHWVCPEGDFDCEFGGYLLALWPPAPDDPKAAAMLAARLDVHGIRWATVGLDRRGSTPVAQVTVFRGEDDASVRAALAPFRVQIGWAEPARTERFTESTPDGTFCGLRLTGGGWLRSAADWTDRTRTWTLTSSSETNRSASVRNIDVAGRATRCCLMGRDSIR